ncbi:putative NBD/HSP70 family sugar kinase [Evansella vedderi]|uniref:NBD/HSP70 family sugar kinase n=1 Tax=Evansella vedderi TaxID=38282 RepID=A0ABT9ZST8_9BACI|nr:ROK family transcriptional regulator [Evansella vedderi]MDQ0253240.1 putative NBD/HSP70 family sugar kinase [Evansella vedderi]
MTIVDSHFIRELNESKVLEMIIKKRLISRAEISKVCGLNKATVSSIVKSLVQKNLIEEVGIGDSKGGRRPVMFRFQEKAGLSLSIDIGYNYISSMLTYLDGTKIDYRNTTVEIKRESILNELITIINNYIKASPKTYYGIIGISIGIHGIINDNEIIFSPNYNLSKLNFSEELEKHFNIPIVLENEANLSALGEKFCSTNTANLICISIGSGIGSGIIIDNKLFKGRKGFSGEIGHTILVPHGLECPCGNYGCFEQYASEKSLLMEYSKYKGRDVTFNELKNAYNTKENYAVRIVDKFIHFMAQGINNLINSFNPELVIINSKFTNEIDGTIEKIEESLFSKMNNYSAINSSKLGKEAPLLGGNYINILNFLNINEYEAQNINIMAPNHNEIH